MLLKKPGIIVHTHPLANCGNRDVQKEIDDKASRIRRAERLSALNEIQMYGVIFSLNYLRSIKHSPNPYLLNKYCGLKEIVDSL